MELSVDEFIEGLFSKEATEQPSDSKKPDDNDVRLPDWYDEKTFTQARRFYWDNCFQFATSMSIGLVAVFAIPSIIRVLAGSRRSSSVYSAYKRYLSTVLHTTSWFENELKPGSISWRSLTAVRNRHFRAGMTGKSKGYGIVSQRDLALTQFGFMGYSMLKPDKFAIRQMEDGDWEAYNHFWRVIGHMIGIEDKYNLCRKSYGETLQVLEVIMDRVFTPGLENVPEYFEHMARSMLDGLWCLNPTINVDGMIYWAKHLANVPGYIYSESDRLDIQKRIKAQLKERLEDTGVESSALMATPAIEIGAQTPRLLFLRDYETIDEVPQYKQLPYAAKYRLALQSVLTAFHNTYIGRLCMCAIFKHIVFLWKYFPYLGFFRFGVIASYVNMFVEDPIENTEPIPNSEYYKLQQKPIPWYKEVLSIFF